MKTLRRDTKRERTHRFYQRMGDLGFNFEETETLRRAELTLHRWNEAECGDSNNHCSWAIKRDPETDKPFRCVYPYQGKSYRVAIADREKGARKRVATVLRNHPLLWSYYQTDPRGCALYVGRVPDSVDNQKQLGEWLEQNYNQGIAVCID